MPKMTMDGGVPAAGIGPGEQAETAPLRIYRGRRPDSVGGIEVTVNGLPLGHVVAHSPSGFEWGYPGSGPADLALSILADYFGERQSAADARNYGTRGVPRAWSHHQAFKWAFVAGWRDEWAIDSRAIDKWLAGQKEQEG